MRKLLSPARLCSGGFLFLAQDASPARLLAPQTLTVRLLGSQLKCRQRKGNSGCPRVTQDLAGEAAQIRMTAKDEVSTESLGGFLEEMTPKLHLQGEVGSRLASQVNKG